MTEADGEEEWRDSELAKTNPIVELPRLPPQNRSASGDIQAKVTEHELTEISTVRVLDERALKLPSENASNPSEAPTAPREEPAPPASSSRALLVIGVIVLIVAAVGAVLALR